MTAPDPAIRIEQINNIISVVPDVNPIHEPASRPSTASSTDADSKLFEGHNEEQIKLMEEVCIVLNYDDKPIGSASKKTCHILPNIAAGLLHRAFSVFLFNDKNELLLQQRADEKITFANMWTNTCCSHPLAIPTEIGFDLESSIVGVKNAAQRKLLQELGIRAEEVS
ncbi:hypothetical protein D0Z00_001344 [Geotrichum galactomycetum]|uniref:Uncharacterized protein n=1 Tax=Geotrichum galactomycetum TaxID=27317 RepID=A0ACB6V7C9_9ASCO|nr:hypothetical protein D0Z00_001344 [Geotrichum candidum]